MGVFNGDSIYNDGVGAGGGNFSELNEILRKNCFLTYVNKMSNDSNILNYDSRIDNELYKLKSIYEKVDGIRNAGLHQIPLGFNSDNLDLFISFWNVNHVDYNSVITNSYIDDDTNNFGIYTSDTIGGMLALVDTCWRNIDNYSYQNGSALELSNVKKICKDVFFPFNNFKTGNHGNENISEMKLFSNNGLITIVFSLTVFKSNVLIMDLIPCIRKSDNVSGFYNKVNDEFIYNVDNPNELQGVYLF